MPALSGRCEGVRGFNRNLDRLPAAEVSTPGEQVEGETMDGLLGRNIELVVVLFVAGDLVEDQCDALSVQAEKAIYASGTVMDMVQELVPESMSFEVQGDGEKRVARMELSWAALVQTFENDPETAI